MGGKSKWLKGAAPDDSLDEVARRAIESRLELVWQFLSLAVEHWQESAENVHQLRVWSRRTVAAMSIFGELLPQRRARWMKKQLKRVRRAAGDARDLDVFQARLAARAEVDGAGPSDKLQALAVSHREKAQEPIERMQRKFTRKDFCRRSSALVERIRPRGRADNGHTLTYASAAPAALRPLVDDFLAAARHVSSDYAVLHALRVKGKKLRYAMEIFAGALPPSFREELYPQLASIQERLGEINDHATAHEHLHQWRKEVCEPQTAEALAKLVAEEERAMDQARDAFLQWLTPERLDQLEQGFNSLLDAERAPVASPTPAEPMSGPMAEPLR